MTKISQLPADTSPTSDDYVPSLDNASGALKKSTWANVAAMFASLALTLQNKTLDNTNTLSGPTLLTQYLDFSAMGVISATTGSGNFANVNTTIDTLTLTIPSGCTKVYIFGMIRLQAQNAQTQDISCWVDYNNGAATTKSAVFTSVNTFNGSTVALIDSLAVTSGSKTFKLIATTVAGGSANVGYRTVFIIPAHA